jgi:hemoglobin-like flavoprotein
MDSYRQHIEPLSKHHIDLVKDSIIKINFEEFAPHYFHLLFQEYPAFRGKYNQDLVETASRYMGLLELSIYSFKESSPGKYHFQEAMFDPLRNLGMRHSSFGVLEEHFRVAINIFIEALRQELSVSWSSEVEYSWRHLFQHIAYWMSRKPK